MREEPEREYHQVGVFYAHFRHDLIKITEALTSSGYGVCKTPSGDMIIMKREDYNSEEIYELEHDDDDNDFLDNIRNFPREY